MNCPRGRCGRSVGTRSQTGSGLCRETWVHPGRSGSRGAGGGEPAWGEPRPRPSQTPCPGTQGRPPCSASRLSVLRKDRWRHQLLHGEVRQGPPALPPDPERAGPPQSLGDRPRPRPSRGSRPSPVRTSRATRPLGTGQGAWQGLVPWAHPSEEGGRGPRLRSPAPPRSSGSESHPRTGASTVFFLDPGVRTQRPGPSGACLGGV